MAPGLAPRVRWIDGSATLTTKKSRMKTNVPHMMTASGAHLAHARTGACSSALRSDLLLVVVMTMSLRPPITGESSHGICHPSDEPAAVAHQRAARQLVNLTPGLHPVGDDAEERVITGLLARVPLVPGRVGVLRLLVLHQLRDPVDHGDVPHAPDADSHPAAPAQVASGRTGERRGDDQTGA